MNHPLMSVLALHVLLAEATVTTLAVGQEPPQAPPASAQVAEPAEAPTPPDAGGPQATPPRSEPATVPTTETASTEDSEPDAESSGSTPNAPQVVAAAPDESATPSVADAETAMAIKSESDALLLEEETNSPLAVRVYGFIDVSYRHAFMEKDSPWYIYINRQPSFYVGNFNLYLDSQISDAWRSLAEVRFTYLPAGAERNSIDRDYIVQTRSESQYADYTDFGRERAVGGIMLERAQLEYRPNDYLTVTAGQWLSPYGIWVVDHSSPVIIGVFRPFIIGSQLIPERQVGLLGTGQVPLGENLDLVGAVGLSNGRSDWSAFEDMDKNKAVTGRLALEYHGFGEAVLGGAVYRGKDTHGIETIDTTSTTNHYLDISQQYDEVTYTGDLRWVKGPIHLQTEWLYHEVRYKDRHRPAGIGGTFEADYSEWGGYGLVGYRLPWFEIMPYAKAERSPHPAAKMLGIASEFVILTGGLNIRPIPSVVGKIEFDYGYFTDKDVKEYSKSSHKYLNTQLAWAF